MFLALAELRRSLGRFALLGGAVGLLVLLLLFFQAVAGALTGGLTGGFEEADADVWVYAEQARRNPSASVLDPGTLAAVNGVLQATDGVADASPVTFTVFDVDGEPATVVAADPGSAARPAELDEGRPATGPGEVEVGASTFTGEAPDAITLGGTELAVVGRNGDATLNVLPTYFVARDVVAAAVSERAGEEVPLLPSAVAVGLADGADAAAVAERVTAAVDGAEAVDRATAIASLPGAGTITRSFGILYVLLYLVVAIVTAVFFLILTVQKRDSLVLLRAVGADRGDVVRPVLVQVLVVVGLAVVLGTAAALGLLTAARDVFGAGLDLGVVVRSAGALLVLGLVAGLLSLRRVLQVEPVEAVSDGGI